MRQWAVRSPCEHAVLHSACAHSWQAHVVVQGMHVHMQRAMGAAHPFYVASGTSRQVLY
jgi:hypothetical protein